MSKVKIVYNGTFGGFELTDEQEKRYRELKGMSPDERFYSGDLDRTDPILVKVVEENFKDRYCSDLEIAEIDEGTLYRIAEYDGNERVMTISDYEWTKA